MDKGFMAQAFNRWMDEFTNNPESFEEMDDMVCRHLREKNGGEEPSYGQRCTELLAIYMKEVSNNEG